MIDALLHSFHLSPKEKLAFTKVLELGSQPASSIARVCELPRNTVRSILDVLVKQGLLLKTRRANTQYYTAESVPNIIRALKHKKLRMEEEISSQIELLERYGDEITSKRKSKSRPKITFYEGTAGLEKVYEDTLMAKTPIRSWASFEKMHEAMPEYFRTYYRRRTEKEICIQSIHPDSLLARERQKLDKEELRESRLVPSEKHTWTPEIQVYDDKINIASWKEKLGIIIESPEIADAMKTIFDLCFEAAK